MAIAHPEAILEIVEEANKAILEVYGLPDFDVELKADATPVTSADIAAHEILLEGLGNLFPDIPIVSEEGDQAANRLTSQAERFLLVDPLDGTKEFIAKTGQFTVCVALIENNHPSLGVVSAPALGVSYYGGRNIGSYRVSNPMNGDQLAPIHVAEGDTGVITISRSHQNKATADFIAQHYPDHRLEVVGSQLKYTRIAEGLADVSPKLESRLNTWDLAAGHAILEGAGGSIIRVDGSEIDYQADDFNVPDFIASK